MALGSRDELEQKKASLMPYAKKRRFAILQGDKPPSWEPRL
jgi:hypothetical protein